MIYECDQCGFLTRNLNDWGGFVGPCPDCGASCSHRVDYDWDEPLANSRSKSRLVAVTIITTLLGLSLLAILTQCGSSAI